MDGEKIRILSPCYMRDFYCKGPSCEDNCCARWNIDIDYETYKKYHNENEKDLKVLFEKYIIMKGNPSSRDDYARIVLNHDNFCPFLTENRYCLIQLRKGEEYQSKICKTFPRIHHIINGVLEESVTLSCPEAARLALLNPEGIDFYEREDLFSHEFYIRNVLDTNNAFFINQPAKYFLELRSFSINIIKDRRYTLSERLIFLGMFFREADIYVTEGKVDNLPQLIESYTGNLSDPKFMGEISGLPVSGSKQVLELLQFLTSKFIEKTDNTDYSELLKQALLGIGFISPYKLTELGEIYHEAYHTYYLPYISNHGYILENYLVNHIFKVLFPFSAGYQSLFEKYVKLVLKYSLIKIQLIGLSGFHKGLTTDIVIKLVQNYTKEAEHNSNLLEELYNLLKKNNHTSATDITILIKN